MEFLIVLGEIIILFILFKVLVYDRLEEGETAKKDKYFDKLSELQDLKEKNIITEKEFEEEKKKISNI